MIENKLTPDEVWALYSHLQWIKQVDAALPILIRRLRTEKETIGREAKETLCLTGARPGANLMNEQELGGVVLLAVIEHLIDQRHSRAASIENKVYVPPIPQDAATIYKARRLKE